MSRCSRHVCLEPNHVHALACVAPSTSPPSRRPRVRVPVPRPSVPSTHPPVPRTPVSSSVLLVLRPIRLVRSVSRIFPVRPVLLACRLRDRATFTHINESKAEPSITLVGLPRSTVERRYLNPCSVDERNPAPPPGTRHTLLRLAGPYCWLWLPPPVPHIQCCNLTWCRISVTGPRRQNTASRSILKTGCTRGSPKSEHKKNSVRKVVQDFVHQQ